MLGIGKESKIPIKFDAFNEKSILNKMQSPHIFVCKICGQSFGNSAQLYMEHMKELHDVDCSSMLLEGKEYSSLKDRNVDC